MGVGAGSKDREVGMVGYLVSVSQNPVNSQLAVGQQAELYIYSHIREDALDLYGFGTKLEKELFLCLLAVNGIGPKSALAALSAAEPLSLINAIVTGDQKFLTKIPGIGKKTAERVVVELRDVMQKKINSGIFSNSSANAGVSSTVNTSVLPSSGVFSGAFQDAKSALVSLGYRENDVYPLLKRILDEPTSPPLKAEDLIKTALRQLL